MNNYYNITKGFLLNGIYSYALFGLYSLTISPFITQFFAYGEYNLFVAIFGLIMLFAEYFALYFKLQMIRSRSEIKRINYKKETGTDIVPGLSLLTFYGFFMRMAFRTVILMTCLTALGYNCFDMKMSPIGTWIICIFFFADMFGFILIYVNAGLNIGFERSASEMEEELQDDEEWDEKKLEISTIPKYIRLEFFADVILQIYSAMLFTVFWKYINQCGIDILKELVADNQSGFTAALVLFTMLFVVVLLGLMPMRIAYWIEDSMEAYSVNDKLNSRITFILVAIFTCSPVIIKYFTTYIIYCRTIPDYINYLLPIIFFLLLLISNIILFKSKK